MAWPAKAGDSGRMNVRNRPSAGSVEMVLKESERTQQLWFGLRSLDPKGTPATTTSRSGSLGWVRIARVAWKRKGDSERVSGVGRTTGTRFGAAQLGYVGGSFQKSDGSTIGRASKRWARGNDRGPRRKRPAACVLKETQEALEGDGVGRSGGQRRRRGASTDGQKKVPAGDHGSNPERIGGVQSGRLHTRTERRLPVVGTKDTDMSKPQGKRTVSPLEQVRLRAQMGLGAGRGWVDRNAPAAGQEPRGAGRRSRRVGQGGQEPR